MNSNAVQMVSKEVYRQFPDFSGVKPKVQAQNSSARASAEKTYLLTYHQNAQLGTGKVLPRWVRVVADESGKILKISTSR
jgi:hypothetical protein